MIPCKFPGCDRSGNHRHHVTYDPPVIKRLCCDHHKEITMLNGQRSRKFGYHRLSNNHRWRIWYEWLAGKSKPRRTSLALKFVAGMDDWEREHAQHRAIRARGLTVLIETVSSQGHAKFLLWPFSGPSLPWKCGHNSNEHVLVLDQATCEGRVIRPEGCDYYEGIYKSRVWVSPLFKPVLAWLGKQDCRDLDRLPNLVTLLSTSPRT